MKIGLASNYRMPDLVDEPLDPNRKSTTMPDQALTVEEIMRRFTKGLPVAVTNRDPVYIDQNDFDYEQISRMSFDEKFAMAQQFELRADYIKGRLAREQREAELAKAISERDRRLHDEKARKQQTGIDPLDNTMPVDTKQTTK